MHSSSKSPSSVCSAAQKAASIAREGKREGRSTSERHQWPCTVGANHVGVDDRRDDRRAHYQHPLVAGSPARHAHARHHILTKPLASPCSASGGDKAGWKRCESEGLASSHHNHRSAASETEALPPIRAPRNLPAAFRAPRFRATAPRPRRTKSSFLPPAPARRFSGPTRIWPESTASSLSDDTQQVRLVQQC